jgi:hypothetical protein
MPSLHLLERRKGMSGKVLTIKHYFSHYDFVLKQICHFWINIPLQDKPQQAEVHQTQRTKIKHGYVHLDDLLQLAVSKQQVNTESIIKN